MPKPNKNTQTVKIPATIKVNLLSPFSALFCDEKTCAAPPIPAMPSPLGECIKISAISKNADITCVVQTSVSKVFLLLFCYLARAASNEVCSF